jgi:phage protein D
MIFKNKFPNAPDVSVVLSGVAVDYNSIESISFELTEDAHDIASITFAGLIPNAITDYVGAPVFISIGISQTRFTSFYGYVSYVSPESITRRGLINNSPFQRATVVCFGASYDMSEKKHTVWESTSIPLIVEKIANRYKYSYSVPNDYFTWNRLLQDGISDWDFLKQVCSSVGYCVHVSGTHINIYDPYTLLARKLPYVELLSLRGTNADVTYGPGRIMEFSGTFGDVTPDGTSADYEYTGIDSSGKAVVVYVGTEYSTKLGEVVPAGYTHYETVNTGSVEMLTKYAVGKMKKRYPYNAKVIITGVPDPIPGSIAKVNNYDSKFDGLWIVKSVKHTVTRSNYLTEVTIATDSTNDATPSITPTTPFVTPPVPTLLDNVWIASQMDAVVYA